MFEFLKASRATPFPSRFVSSHITAMTMMTIGMPPEDV
jgi:hypothetical protein